MTLTTIEIEWRSCDRGGHRTEPDFATTRFFTAAFFGKVLYSLLATQFGPLPKSPERIK